MIIILWNDYLKFIIFSHQFCSFSLYNDRSSFVPSSVNFLFQCDKTLLQIFTMLFDRKAIRHSDSEKYCCNILHGYKRPILLEKYIFCILYGWLYCTVLCRFGDWRGHKLTQKLVNYGSDSLILEKNVFNHLTNFSFDLSHNMTKTFSN